jgi:hypothetical protein
MEEMWLRKWEGKWGQPPFTPRTPIPIIIFAIFDILA